MCVFIIDDFLFNVIIAYFIIYIYAYTKLIQCYVENITIII